MSDDFWHKGMAFSAIEEVVVTSLLPRFASLTPTLRISRMLRSRGSARVENEFKDPLLGKLAAIPEYKAPLTSVLIWVGRSQSTWGVSKPTYTCT